MGLCLCIPQFVRYANEKWCLFQGYKFFGFDPETLCYIGTKEEKERLEEERTTNMTSTPSTATSTLLSATSTPTTITTLNINNGLVTTTITPEILAGQPQMAHQPQPAHQPLPPPAMPAYLTSS